MIPKVAASHLTTKMGDLTGDPLGYSGVMWGTCIYNYICILYIYNYICIYSYICIYTYHQYSDVVQINK